MEDDERRHIGAMGDCTLFSPTSVAFAGLIN